MNTDKVCNILDFGAVGDGVFLNTTAIQNAIDNCPEHGIVYIPDGIFLSGAVHLKSNMTLHLSSRAILLGSTDIKEYPVMKYRFEGLEQMCYTSLINAGIRDVEKEKIENIIISGSGVIDASGSALRKNEIITPDIQRGRAVCIANAKNIFISGITIRQSPAWCLHLIYSKNIEISNVHIHTKYDENGIKYPDIINGDGIDIDSCSNIRIHDCEIASQDDCIAIKSGKNEEGRSIGIPTENVEIYDCLFKYGFGVAVGSEVSGGVNGVYVHDCIFDNTYSAASIKSPRGRGAVIENILFKNIKHKYYGTEHHDCEWFRGALYIDEFYSHIEFDIFKKERADETTPHMRNISFENVEVETSAGNAIYITGLPERYVENISLKNVTAKGKYGFIANNVTGLHLENVTVLAENGDSKIFTNTELV